MAAKDRGHPPDIKSTLIQEGHRFSYIQAVRLLNFFQGLAKSRGGENKEPGDPALSLRQQVIRVRPDLSLDFPGTDIVSIEEKGAADQPQTGGMMHFLITATFLGIYGASSPLPAFYTEDLMDEAREDRSVARDFLDIINSPFYSLRFQCWSKYRLGVKILEEEDPHFLERLFCLLGLGQERIRSEIDDAFGLIRYIGLFTQTPRSAQGLETLLSDAFQQPRLKVIPCIPGWARIPEDQLCRIGISGNRLGLDSYLGRKIKDRMGKFRVRVAPVDWPDFQNWLPDTTRFKKLRTLIKLYLDQPLQWDLEALLSEDNVRTTRIGEIGGSRLGWDTWLFSGDTCVCEAKACFQNHSANKE